MSKSLRVILAKSPSRRTSSDVFKLLVYCRRLKCFSRYSLAVQRALCRVCVFRKFEAGRVIVRQGHTAEGIYFVTSGSLYANVRMTKRVCDDSVARDAAPKTEGAGEPESLLAVPVPATGAAVGEMKGSDIRIGGVEDDAGTALRVPNIVVRGATPRAGQVRATGGEEPVVVESPRPSQSFGPEITACAAPAEPEMTRTNAAPTKPDTEQDEQTAQVTVALLEKGEVFGLEHVSLGTPRDHTMVAKTDVELLLVTDGDFHAHVKALLQGERARIVQHLRRMPVMARWPVARLHEAHTHVSIEPYVRGSVIVADSTRSNDLFFVLSGRAGFVRQLQLAKKSARKVLMPDMHLRSASDLLQPSFVNLAGRKSVVPAIVLTGGSRRTFRATARRVQMRMDLVRHYREACSEKVFVTISALRPGDHFGLTALLGKREAKYALVSNECGEHCHNGVGRQSATAPCANAHSRFSMHAEVIRMPAHLYTHYQTPQAAADLERFVKSYPCDEDLVKDYQQSCHWQAFKKRVMHDALARHGRS